MGRIRVIALAAIVIGVVLSVIGLMGGNPGQFYQSYLFAYVFWVGLPLGSFGVMMLHNLVGGGWGWGIKRVLESSAKTIIVMAVLFIPIWMAMSSNSLFEWSNEAVRKADAVLAAKELYLNPTSWTARAVLYFVFWVAAAFGMVKMQRKREVPGEPIYTGRLQTTSALLLVGYFLLTTFAAFDWVMSLQPHWYSTIFGMIVIVGQVLSTFAFSTIMLIFLARRDSRLSSRLVPLNFHDLGNLMFAFTIFWAYVSFSQFLIMWSANIPEEVPWYTYRLEGGYGVIAGILLIFHFFLPFFVLLNRGVKRNPAILGKVAIYVLIVRLIETYWLVRPSIDHGNCSFNIADIGTVLGIGGIWGFTFLYFFNRGIQNRAIMPVNAPAPVGGEVIEQHG